MENYRQPGASLLRGSGDWKSRTEKVRRLHRHLRGRARSNQIGRRRRRKAIRRTQRQKGTIISGNKRPFLSERRRRPNPVSLRRQRKSGHPYRPAKQRRRDLAKNKIALPHFTPFAVGRWTLHVGR